MALTRRQALLATLGTVILGGCSNSKSVQSAAGHRLTPPRLGYSTLSINRGQSVAVPPPPQGPVAGRATQIRAATSTSIINAIPRSQWTTAQPRTNDINAMGTISKITIHHEGMEVFQSTNYRTTAQRIERDRSSHVNFRGWSDIAYHYIIDPAGRIWEARPIAYQGAHVSRNNENNIGIMLLGNFNEQSPSNAQLAALRTNTRLLKRGHNVQRNNIKSHQEIRSTSCPGRNLQRQMDGLRRYVG